ncbi:hypothetical protein BT93_H2921 [Corymbia citriodora subsp. variegata]|nr:hypothetical protein BT93_H2921 [Corymbia citriodora subsp. variegata]
MAEAAALSSLVGKLAMFVEKEVKLLKGVRGEIELISDEFERMKAFLERAESSQEDDPELKVWVKNVREVVYDTEDILDEFMIKLARDHRHGFTRYFHKIKSSVQNLKAHHHISSKIADIKSRDSRISEGHRRYHFKLYCTVQFEEGELVGTDEPIEELIKWLVDGEPELEVVSILGMAGSGKTILAKRVQQSASKSLLPKLCMDQCLKVLQDSRYFEGHDRTTLWRNSATSPSRNGIHEEHEAQAGGERLSAAKRYVIVLDVWNLEALEGIKNAMPNSNFCSRIIITARIADIATVSSNQSKVYIHKPLSPEESWFSLCKKAFRGKPCPPHLILKKCKGLPLAIVAIGGLLLAKDAQEWEMIARSLAAELESSDRMQNFKKIVSLSYNDLHYDLKSCFLSLGVFPEDHVIEYMRLIQGFVEEREDMTKEEVAQRYLKELMNRSLVQIVETTLDGRLRSCGVHALMHDSILSKLVDENFVSFASKWKKELHEKYLSLRRTNVRIIPRSTGKLQNLETLDLKHTLVSKLPVEITKLRKLQHLLVYSYAKLTSVVPFGPTKGFSAPQGIGALASLQKLYFVKAGGGQSKNTMQEIGELSLLRRLGVTNLKKDDAKELCHSLKKMTDLQSLSVGTSSESVVTDLDFLSSPPLLLRTLIIEGCLKKAPHWLPLLNNLASVALACTRLKSSPLIALRNLPIDGETLIFEYRGFPKLKNLYLAKLENLKFVTDEWSGNASPSESHH